MYFLRHLRVIGFVGVALIVLSSSATHPQAAPKPGPRLEPVAETPLLMEGLAQSNFRGLERHLKEQPKDDETWKFARGQALLIAETGNLLLMRPPRNAGEREWMDRATELRESATGLARAIAERDYRNSKAGLGTVAASCNRCHTSFRVPVKIEPWAEQEDRGKPAE